MKNNIRILVCLITMAFLVVGYNNTISAEALVQDISLNGHWEFAYTAELNLTTEKWRICPTPVIPEESAFAFSIEVPGYWDHQLEGMKDAPWWPDVRFNPDYRPIKIVASRRRGYPDVSFPYLLGVGWYRRTIEVPADWCGHIVTLTIGRTVRECYVYVNGGFVGYHIGHSTPFQFDLTKHLRYGEHNELMIAVSNLNRNVSSCFLRGCNNFSTGIRNGVSLHITGGPGKIHSLFLRPMNDFSAIRWWVDLKAPQGTSNQSTQLRWSVSSHEGKVLKEGIVPVRALDVGEFYRKEWDIPADGLKPWSTWDPQLYITEVKWEDTKGKVWDSLKQPSGFRALVRDGKKLLLNGRPIMLRGWCDINYFAPSTHPPNSVDYYKKLIRRMQEICYNFIRFHTYVPPKEYIQAADELGMLLQFELYNSPKRSNIDIEAWWEMIFWSRIHPSVVIYCDGNENICDEGLITFFEKIHDIAKELDPGCLYMPNHAIWGVDFRLSPVPDHIKEPSQYHSKLLERMTKSADVFSPMSLGLKGNALKENWKKFEQEYAVFQRPIIPHETGIIGSYLDLSLENSYTGTNLKNLFSCVRDNLKATGRLHMAQRYYENSARLQSLIRKFTFEKARKCDSVNGYDNLGGWDSHWHRVGYCCGTLNEFLELKYGDTVENILQYNGESVLLLDIYRYHSFWSGDTFDKSVMVSLYGGKPLRNGTLEWRITEGERVLLKGNISNLNAPDGHVTDMDKIVFNWPIFEKAFKVKLSVSVSGSGYNLKNQWDFWIFPKKPATKFTAAADEECLKKLTKRYANIMPLDSNKDMKLRIVSGLTAEHIDHLAKGGDVLLLGSDPFPSSSTRFQPGMAGRPHVDNLATMIYDHPIFASIPNEGFCDWQFESLMEGIRYVIFDKLPIEFDPILEIVSSYKSPRLQAALWEVQTEGGRLFTASCHFDLDDPASVALMDGILTYINGNEFIPKTKVSIESVLKPLLCGK